MTLLWKSTAVRIALLSTTVISGGLLASTGAVAQVSDAQPASAETSETKGVDEIIVTAQFRSQRLQDTPIAITAVKGEELDARGQTDVTNIGSFAPNVNFTPTTSDRGNAVSAFIRGVGQADSSFALEPGVGIYLDDVYLGTTFGSRLDLSDLDRVEILRGPQGTLAGKNSLGGSVKLYSKKPEGTGGGRIEATYGSYNRIDLRGSYDLTLADNLYAYVSGIVRRRNGFVDRLDYGCLHPNDVIPARPISGDGCKVGTEGGQNVVAARVALRYAPTGSPLEINIIGDISEDNSEPAGNKLLVASNPNVRSYDPNSPAGGIPYDSRFLTGPTEYSNYSTYQNGGNFTAFGQLRTVLPGTFVAVPKTTAHGWSVSGTIDYALSDDLSIKSITSYRKAHGYAGTDLDLSPLEVEVLGTVARHKQFTQELRFTGKVKEFADFTIGGFYYKANDRQLNRITVPTSFLDFLLNDPSDNMSKSVFGHVELHLTDKLNVVGGLRYTKDRKEYSFSRHNPDGTLPSGNLFTLNFAVLALNGQSRIFADDNIDYRIGVNYHLTPEIMTYAQVSTGYKGGGVNPRPFNADQIRTFGPEKLTTYEWGAKTEFFNRALRLNGALFFNKYKDMQLTLYLCPTAPCALPANAGDADVFGAELEAGIYPVPGLSITGALGYLDFQYKKTNEAITGVTLDLIAPYTNKWQGSASIVYEAGLANGGALTPRLDWTYQSSFYVNANNSPNSLVDGRSLFNGRLTYTTPDKGWSASLDVSNIFNKFYYVTKFDNIVGLGVASGILGRPREWAITVSRKF
jgi:iron complex outermembrane receptor protein